MGMNLTILEGHMGADAEIRYTQDGTTVANFTMATNEQWKDKDGVTQKRTEWHRVVAWRRLGDVIGEYGGKGRNILVQGRLQTRSWEDKDGITRYVTEVVATNIQLLGSSGNGASRPDKQPGYKPGGVEGETEAPLAIPDDDIPF